MSWSVLMFQDPFMAQAMTLAVDGHRPQAVRDMLEIEDDAREEQDPFRVAIAPASGIISQNDPISKEGHAGVCRGVRVVLDHSTLPFGLTTRRITHVNRRQQGARTAFHRGGWN